MNKEDKTLTAVLGGVLGLAVVMAVASMVQAAPKNYCCPICGVCFATYDELYQHFVTEHPASDINIIWE
jgi:hypothetical protein